MDSQRLLDRDSEVDGMLMRSLADMPSARASTQKHIVPLRLQAIHNNLLFIVASGATHSPTQRFF